MNTWQGDSDLEARLRSAFRSGDLPHAPRRLADALDRVPDAPVAIRVRDRGARRTTLGLLGLAAVLLVGGGLALSGGGVFPRPAPSVSPAVGTRIAYRVAWTDAVPASAQTLAAEVAAIRTRIDATGAVGVTVTSDGPDTVVVAFPTGFDAEPMRSLIGQTGRIAFVPLGDLQASDGDLIDPARFPALFGSEGLANARVDVDQQGDRVLALTLGPTAARLFGDYTAAHVGSTFAITLDDRVVSAPRIMSAIPGGDVQISKGGTAGGWDAAEAAQLVAILRSPLPAPLVEVSLEPGPVEPGPVASPTLPATASPKPTADAATFALEVAPANLGCDANSPPYGRVVIHLDPRAAEPAWAVADTGPPFRLRIAWGATDRGLVGPPPTVVDANANVLAVDGTVIDIPVSGWPSLRGRFVCPGADVVYVLETVTLPAP